MQTAPGPNEKSSQRSDMKSRKNQDVIHTGLLKLDDTIVFDKAAITEQHCSCQSRFIGARTQNIIQRTQKAPSRACQALGERQMRMLKDGQKLVVAERPLQMYSLKGKVGAVVEAAGIAEIANGERASLH